MAEAVRVENPHGDDLEFEGEIVVDDRHHDIGFVKVWRTKGGRYVLKQKRAVRPGILDIDRVARFDSVQKLSEFLGHAPGAKVVAEKLGLSRTLRID